MSYNFSSFHTEAKKALDHITKDIGQLRTGKANSQLLDSVNVEAYGGWMKVNEVANITVPDPTLIVITPWDKSLIASIEKAINAANLNLSAVVDGQVIRIPVPPLTEERRKEMVKLLSQKIEAGRIMFRSVRIETKKAIDQQKGQPGISEDMITADLAQLDTFMKEYNDTLDTLEKNKAADLMNI